MSTHRAVVLDASVFVADAFSHETFHAEAAQLLEALQFLGVECCLPRIVLAEVAAALARGLDHTSLAIEAARLVESRPATRIFDVDGPLGEIAVEIAAQQRIRGCDAVYVALARQLGVNLITLDREQRDRAPEDVVTMTPGVALTELPES